MKNKSRHRDKIIDPYGREIDKCQVPKCRNEGIWEFQQDFGKDEIAFIDGDGSEIKIKGGVISILLCKDHKQKVDGTWNPSMEIDKKHRDYHFNDLLFEAEIEGNGEDQYVVECPVCGSLILRIPFANER